METTVMIELAFFIVFALLGTVVSMKFRQPYVVGLLVFGMLAGPAVFGFVTSEGLITAFSELGSILLLFTVGIEFSISKIMKSGFRALIITTVKMAVLFFFGYETALYFGLDLVTAFFIGSMISITSTALLYKIVHEKGMRNHQVLPLLFSMLIIEDIFAVAALTFVSSLTTGASTDDKIMSILMSLGILGIFYVAMRKPVADAVFRLTATLNEDVMILVSFSLCLVMSMVADFLGLSPAIGAFLAGSIIASLPNSKKIEKTLKPLLLLFASLFFLSLGMKIDPQTVIAHWDIALALVFVFVAGCFASVFSLLYFTGAGVKNALFGASAMVVLGEFSLIIASTATGETGSFLLAVGSVGVLLTAMVSSFLLDRQGKLYEIGEAKIPHHVRFTAGSLAIYFSSIVRDFSPNGRIWRTSLVCWNCVRRKCGRIAFFGLLIVLARVSVRLMALAPLEAAQLRTAVLLMGLVPIAYYLIGILRDITPIFDALSRTIAHHKRNAKTETLILYDAGAALLLLLLASGLPEFVTYLQLPGFFTFADEVALLFAFAFIWDIARHATKLREVGKEHIARAKERRAENLAKLREKRKEIIRRLHGEI